ncbi:EAL domain-containing protein [Pseudomonas sp. NPDC078700]|uniref:EAL domain-containing protein n=1 Tax=Pseudomonas sp. NPDC078700 TaxID=3364424 RepID=UPI0037C91C65
MRSSLKRSLVVLVLVMLALSLWQLTLESRNLQQTQRQLGLVFSGQLANTLSTNMSIKAQSAQALLRAKTLRHDAPDDAQSLVDTLAGIYPAIESIARLSVDGEVVADSATYTTDAHFIASLVSRPHGQPYYYAFTAEPDGRFYLLLTKNNGYWLLRFSGSAIASWLHDQRLNAYQWLLEDRLTQRAIVGPHSKPETDNRIFPPVTATDLAQTTHISPIENSDWQLRALFDEDLVRAQQLPMLAGKFLLFILCSILTLVALYRLLLDQSQLHKANADSKRSLGQAASALGAIEERVLVTDAQGYIDYLNPQAQSLFGLTENACGRHIFEVLPQLDPLLLQGSAFSNEVSPEPLEIEFQGHKRLFNINRSNLSDGANRNGYAWVLRDVTDEQHATRVLLSARRRYQDIFDGTGTALCVLDLSALAQYLCDQQVTSPAELTQWLQENPEQNQQLPQLMRVSETNHVALRLLKVSSPIEVWELLFNQGEPSLNDYRGELLNALLAHKTQFDQEICILTPDDQEHHLWLQINLPEDYEDLNSVTLSITDITSRKHTELSLIERERFWSSVVQAVPDTLYVHDLSNKSVLFSNHHLGLQLGYTSQELKEFGEHFWEHLLHPDDGDYYHRIRSMQHVVGNGILLESQVRWRHRNGVWHWFSIREQALSRNAAGHVDRLIGVAKDISDQIEHSESLRDSEQRYRLLAESTSDVIYSTDNSLQVDYISPSIKTLLGHEPEQIIQQGLFSLVAKPEQLKELKDVVDELRNALDDPLRMAELTDKLQPRLFMFDCLRSDERKVPMELRLVAMWDENNRFKGLHGVARDISQHRRVENELRMAATVFEHSTAAILVTDPAGYIVQTNEAFSHVTGYSSAQVIDQLPSRLTADRQQANQLNFIVSQLNQRGSWEGEVWLKRRDGENFPAWVGITAVQDDEGDLVSYVCFFSDISERKASEQRIHRLAYYDPLTLLPNRTLFQDRLHTSLHQAERQGEWVVLMFLDLDRFKPINDSLGHAAGDRMLKDVATRLAACVNDDDTVARMGGDEFTLLLKSHSSRNNALNRAIHVAEQILASLARAFVLEGREFFVTASIGIALSPQDGKELSQLMKNADTAMYHAKERGKNNFQFYQSDMNARALERIELESDLRHALEQRELVLFYQPQFSCNGQRLTGVEALLRWQHPKRGLVSPDEFIPVLEELGLVVDVGDWVITQACRQLKAWQDDDIRIPKISVNLSARQFADGDLDKRITRILAETEVDAACLELELTESILMNDVANALRTLTSLKRLGLSLAIDDFGTGYSSLNYLKQFPIDVLKIDRSFVDGLPQGEQDGQIARAIIAMAHSLNLAVIAEGVETQAQLDFLRRYNCDEIQGFLLGKPMPAHQLRAQFTGTALFMLS